MKTDEAKKPLRDDERAIYIRHIKRLREQNQLLAEVVATERKARKQAYAWYFARLNNRLLWLFDLMLIHMKQERMIPRR